MDVLITIAQFILALSLLVVLHEWGHFFFARLFKTRVEKFYLFFDFLFPFSNIMPFSLWKKKKGDTEYGIGWFPLGGYVKIAGMVDESMDKEQLAKPPEPWEFRSKKPWQRLLIMLGGIIVNIILAFVIFAGVLYTWGTDKLPMSEVNKNGGILITDSFAYKVGLKDGDKIIAFDGKPAKYYESLMGDFLMSENATVERNGKEETIHFPVDLIGQFVDVNKDRSLFSINLPVMVGELSDKGNAKAAGIQVGDIIESVNQNAIPNIQVLHRKLNEAKNETVQVSVKRGAQNLNIPVKVSEEGYLGFVSTAPESKEEFGKFGYQVEVKRYTLLESLPAAALLAKDRLSNYAKQMGKVFNPKTGGIKGMGGFVSMAKIYGPTWDWQKFWFITGTLSLILAFMNFLPIPGLDGGHVVFTLYEMLTGRKPNEKFLEVATTIGLVFLLLLMVYANVNDVVRNFFR